MLAVAVALLIVQNGQSVQVDWLWIERHGTAVDRLTLTVVAGGLVWGSTKVAIRRAQASNTRHAEALQDLGGESPVERRAPGNPCEPQDR